MSLSLPLQIKKQWLRLNTARRLAAGGTAQSIISDDKWLVERMQRGKKERKWVETEGEEKVNKLRP